MTKYKVEEHRNDVTILLFFFFFFFFSLFCINSVTFRFWLSFDKRTSFNVPSHVYEPCVWFKMADDEGASTADPPPLFSPFEKTPCLPSQELHYGPQTPWGFTTQNKKLPGCVCVCVCVRVWESVCVCVCWGEGTKEGEEEKTGNNFFYSLVGFWEGRLLKTVRMLTPVWPVFQTNLDYFCFCYKWYFRTYAHTHSPVHYFTFRVDGRTTGRKDKRRSEG